MTIEQAALKARETLGFTGDASHLLVASAAVTLWARSRGIDPEGK